MVFTRILYLAYVSYINFFWYLLKYKSAKNVVCFHDVYYCYKLKPLKQGCNDLVSLLTIYLLVCTSVRLSTPFYMLMQIFHIGKKHSRNDITIFLMTMLDNIFPFATSIARKHVSLQVHVWKYQQHDVHTQAYFNMDFSSSKWIPNCFWWLYLFRQRNRLDTQIYFLLTF